mgnify:CR=1 FL=1
MGQLPTRAIHSNEGQYPLTIAAGQSFLTAFSYIYGYMSIDSNIYVCRCDRNGAIILHPLEMLTMRMIYLTDNTPYLSLSLASLSSPFPSLSPLTFLALPHYPLSQSPALSSQQMLYTHVHVCLWEYRIHSSSPISPLFSHTLDSV